MSSVICKKFDELGAAELYAILQARQRVFVVEQKCAYLDADGLDPRAWHLWLERGGKLAAYLRFFDAGVTFAEHSFGRVITTGEARGTGLGHTLVREAIAEMTLLFGAVPIRIGAQAHLERFYGTHGFVRDGLEYLEDGIPHIHMLRRQ